MIRHALRTVSMNWSRCNPIQARHAYFHDFAAARQKICVGLSGGVDSSVVAWLAIRAGFDVTGVFMKNWDGTDEHGSYCHLEEDFDSAKLVADQLRIPLHQVDLSKQYWNDVFEPYLDAHDQNATPNPDVGCNRHVKFGAFLDACQRDHGAAAIATGHYARLESDAQTKIGPACGRQTNTLSDVALAKLVRDPSWLPNEVGHSITHGTENRQGSAVSLLQGIDASKDQSYFLAQVDPRAWHKVWMPLGHLRKADVRRIAAAAGLSTASRKDSAGICFIGKRRMGDFLPGYLSLRPGIFAAWPDEQGGNAGARRAKLKLDNSPGLGPHNGTPLYTEGQSARIGGLSQRTYVAKKGVDATQLAVYSELDLLPSGRSKWPLGNDIAVCVGRTHPVLYAKCVFLDARKTIMQSESSAERDKVLDLMRSEGGLPVACRFRNLQPLIRQCTAHLVDGSQTIRVDLPLPHRALSPGQVAVLHEEGEIQHSEGAGGSRFAQHCHLPVLASAPIMDVGPSMWHCGRRSPFPLDGQTSLYKVTLAKGSHPDVMQQSEAGDTVANEDFWIE